MYACELLTCTLQNKIGDVEMGVLLADGNPQIPKIPYSVWFASHYPAIYWSN